MSAIKKILRYPFTIYSIVIFLILTLIVLFPVIYFALVQKESEKCIHRILRFWGKAWFFCIGIKFKAVNNKNYTPGQTYIFIANHISYLDIPTIVLAVDTPVKILGKAELSKVPLFGWIYRIAVISVDRGSAKSKSDSIMKLKAMLQKDVSIIVFPEGGIHSTNQPLNEFYIGVFKLSKELDIPIAPILLLNTKERLHYSSIFKLNPGITTVKYLPLIDPDNYQTALDMKQFAYEAMYSEMALNYNSK